MRSGRPGAARSFDEFLHEATGIEAASVPHSFQKRSATPMITEVHASDGPTVARYSLSGQAPRLTDALPLAERIHAALVELSDGSSIFTGCDEAGRPLKGHAHAYILSESNLDLGRGSDGEITHVTIYAPAGFGSVEITALKNLRDVWGFGLQVQLNLMGLGIAEDFSGQVLERGCSPLLAQSRIWISRTPFISTRHPKVTRAGVPKRDSMGLQIGGPEHELRRLLRLAGFPEPVAVEPVAGTWLGGREVAWREFQCQRESGERRRAGRAGYGFRIEFPEAVRGPVAVGYGAHFGMGMFVSDRIVNAEDGSMVGA